MSFPPRDPAPKKEIPAPPEVEPGDLPWLEEAPFEDPPDLEPIEPLDPDDEPEDQAPRPRPI